ncbi:MAG: hypothetical protein ABL893_18540, partial [Hyphomicrobium sp.]
MIGLVCEELAPAVGGVVEGNGFAAGGVTGAATGSAAGFVTARGSLRCPSRCPSGRLRPSEGFKGWGAGSAGGCAFNVLTCGAGGATVFVAGGGADVTGGLVLRGGG